MSFTESLDIVHDGHYLKRTIFQPTVKMSTYLLAFIVSEFKYVEDASDKTKVTEEKIIFSGLEEILM